MPNRPDNAPPSGSPARWASFVLALCGVMENLFVFTFLVFALSSGRLPGGVLAVLAAGAAFTVAMLIFWVLRIYDIPPRAVALGGWILGVAGHATLLAAVYLALLPMSGLLTPEPFPARKLVIFAFAVATLFLSLVIGLNMVGLRGDLRRGERES